MFFGLENTQKAVSDSLEDLARRSEIPSSLLFSGPAFSSRMYAALCVARFYKAGSDSVIIISDRNYGTRIKTAVNLFMESKTEEDIRSSAAFLKNTVGEYLMQYGGALLDGAASSRKKEFAEASDLFDLISDIDYASQSGPKEKEAFIKKVEKSLSVMKAEKPQAISVNQIRAIKTWAATTSLDGRQKIVVIEGLENTTPSCSNALLKIIEEPPEKTTFIIITENAGRIPATILSRTRKFTFSSFSSMETNYVLSALKPSVYVRGGVSDPGRADSGSIGALPKDLKSFFTSGSGVNLPLILENARRLSLREKIDMKGLVAELEASSSYGVFFEALLESLRERHLDALGGADSKGNTSVAGEPVKPGTEASRRGEGSPRESSLAALSQARRISLLALEVENAVRRAAALNQNPRLTLENVVFLFAKHS